MSAREVIVISDTDDTEPANDYAYFSDDSEIGVVAVSSPAPEPPSSSQPHSASWGDVSSIWDRSDAEDSDAGLLEPAALVRNIQSQNRASRGSGTASGSQSQRTSNASTTPEKRKRAMFEASSDSDDSLVVEPVPKKPTKRRKKKNDEEKAYEKAEKEANKLAKQEETRRKKEAAAAEKAAEKLAKKAHKDANKLVTNKKATLPDMTIELSGSLLSSPLYGPLRQKMEEFDCPLAQIAEEDAIVKNLVTGVTTNVNALGMKLIRWKRRVTATYDEHKRHWIPLEKDKYYTRTEGTYLIFIEGRPDLRYASVTEQVHKLRAALGPKYHIHLMICGWKPSRKQDRDEFEEVLVKLQVRERVFVERVPDVEVAVNWIYNMTADLGIKPHKLIERSHLPFSTGGSSATKVGKSDEETMILMLSQLPRLSEPKAKAIVREYGTINGIMEAYLKRENEHRGSGATMLADVELNRTRTGKGISNALGPALSGRLYTLLWGEDPKALVN